MRILQKHLELVVLILIVGCNTPADNTGTENTGAVVNEVADSNIVNPTIEEPSPATPPKRIEYFYVHKKTGTFYFDTPNGTVLGRLPFSTYIAVALSSSEYDSLRIGKEPDYGEWFQVVLESDTVYILSSTVTRNFYRPPEVEIFYATPFVKYRDDVQQGYVNLSESNRLIGSVPGHRFDGHPVRFSKNEKDQAFDFSPEDTVFIFNFSQDSIIKYAIEELPAIAYEDIYSQGGDGQSGYDYTFGLDLGEKYTLRGESLAYIGNENPFQTKEVKALNWNKIDNEAFPIKKDFADPSQEIVTFEFQTPELKYYLQKYIQGCSIDLVVTDNSNDSIVYYRNYHSRESIAVPCHFGTGSDLTYGWTGKIFKNRSPIIYGLESHIFGCPKIEFIAEEEHFFVILCDNRH